MTTKNDKSGVERSRLTLLLGMTAAAGSGGCYALSPNVAVENARVVSTRSRAPAAPAQTPEPGSVGGRDPAGANAGGGGGGGGGGSY